MSKANTAKIKEGYCCKSCGWPIISCCVNNEMAATKPFKDWDWWVYCSNKACDHHRGTGVFQTRPDFVVTWAEFLIEHPEILK